jgi:hypothetical protein
MKKSSKILLSIVLALVILRLLLPFFVKNYVNKALQNLDGYTGSVTDIDIALIRGAYQIEGLIIKKRNGTNEKPFINIPKTDLSIDWNALFKRRIVGEVVCFNPKLNFSLAASKSESQTGTEEDWTKLVKELLPVDINRFEVINGVVSLENAIDKPKTDVKFLNFDAELRNISNVENKNNKLPSPLKATADLEGIGGKLNFTANLQLLKKVPDFEYDMKLIDIQAIKLNPLAEYYENINFNEGKVSIISEMAMADRKIKGYVKPIGNGVKIFALKEPDKQKRTPKQFIKELVVEVGKKIVTNPKEKQVASRIPISGSIDNIKTQVWPIIFSSFRNAYIEAFKKKIEPKTFFSEL